MKNEPLRYDVDGRFFYDVEGICYCFDARGLGKFLLILCRFLYKFNSIFRVWKRDHVLGMFSEIFKEVPESPDRSDVKFVKGGSKK